jgi:DNA (cytosine-5)-methyltransferase 1
MRVVSLFSGAGGLDLGFRNAGHDLLWANDNDRDCKDTYMANISKHFQLGDISDISYKDIPDSEVVIGGFPCQGFSCANMKRSKDDERNEMYLQFVRVLREKTPNFFVAENVRGILSLEKGLVLKMILEDFRESGYHVQYTLVNAADYGVPQNRFRVFFIGVREDLKIPVPSIPAPTHSKNDEHLKTPWVT